MSAVELPAVSAPARPLDREGAQAYLSALVTEFRENMRVYWGAKTFGNIRVQLGCDDEASELYREITEVWAALATSSMPI